MSNKFFTWDDAFESNIQSVDSQHKIIVQLLNELYEIILYDGKEEKVSDIINKLKDYSIYHFQEEEKLFSEHKYPLIDKHIDEHQKFIKEIQTFSEKYEKGESFLALDLISYLKDWLIDHILISDQKFAKFINKVV